MRQMRRTQATVRTYQPCVTVNTAIQGISANGSKPGSGCTSKARVKGERESQVSQIQTSCSCGTQGRSWHFLNLAKGIDHKRPVTHAEIWPQSTHCSHRMSGRGALAVLLCLSHYEALCQQETTSVMGFQLSIKLETPGKMGKLVKWGTQRLQIAR